MRGRSSANIAGNADIWPKSRIRDELFKRDRYPEHGMRALVKLGDTGLSWRCLRYVAARYAASIVVTGPVGTICPYSRPD